jgi:hypothetical protein
MGELIAGLVEAIVALFAAFLEALPAIFEGLVYVLTASVTLIAYAVSPRFRKKKRKEWADKPKEKYLKLGISGVCLISLISLAVWLWWPTPQPAVSSGVVRIGKGKTDEDVRLRLVATTVNGATNDVTIAVKKGGVRKIFETDSLAELRKAIRTNVTVVGARGSLQPGGAANGSQPIRSETNSTSSTAGSRR